MSIDHWRERKKTKQECVDIFGNTRMDNALVLLQSEPPKVELCQHREKTTTQTLVSEKANKTFIVALGIKLTFVRLNRFFVVKAGPQSK